MKKFFPFIAMLALSGSYFQAWAASAARSDIVEITKRVKQKPTFTKEGTTTFLMKEVPTTFYQKDLGDRQVVILDYILEYSTIIREASDNKTLKYGVDFGNNGLVDKVIEVNSAGINDEEESQILRELIAPITTAEKEETIAHRAGCEDNPHRSLCHQSIYFRDPFLSTQWSMIKFDGAKITVNDVKDGTRQQTWWEKTLKEVLEDL